MSRMLSGPLKKHSDGDEIRVPGPKNASRTGPERLFQRTVTLLSFILVFADSFLVQAAEPTGMTMTIEHPRHLAVQTPVLSAKRVVVAAPRTPHGQKLGRSAYQAFVKLGARAELLPDPPGDTLQKADGPIIVIGNLSDSRCVRELYFRFLCATDLWYPGPGGYELRTLCDPLGTGHNIILIGYSDEAGAQAATKEFIARLRDPLPHLADLKVTRLPLADEDDKQAGQEPLLESPCPPPDGWMYYLTGEPQLGQEYRQAWKSIIKTPQEHLGSLSRFVIWRLVEDMNLFSEEERLAITRFFYEWAQSPEGWPHVFKCPRVQSPHMPRQNHELIPALALAYAAEYFRTHYPGVSGPEKWAEVARRAFEPHGPAWKPLCDGLCHGWNLSQPCMLEYALLDPSHSYFEQGGARKAAECAMAIVNNEGVMPSAGDYGLSRQFPGPSLRIAAMYYDEGRYQFVANLVPPSLRNDLVAGSAPYRAYAVGVKPKMPTDMIGVTVVPVDRRVYEVWQKEPSQAVWAVASPPSAPIEQCFDKLAIRTGWKREDDYLLIDGLGGGSHSYDDAGGILDYARLGVSAIVSEDSLLFTSPEKHSLVTVVRDGESRVIPGFAVLEANEKDAQGNFYIRIRQKDYSGADWVREVHLRPKSCAVFVDTVIAREPGDYAVEAHFRTPARLSLNGNEARCKRNSPCAGPVDFRIESSCEPSQLIVAEEPVHLRVHSRYADQTVFWKARYHTDDVVLTSLDARLAGRMEAGQAVRLSHLVQLVGPGELPMHLSTTDGSLFVSDGKARHELKTLQAAGGFKHMHVTPSSVPADLSEAPRLQKIFDADGNVTSIRPISGGRLAVGTDNGRVTLLDPQGQSVWSVSLAPPVHDIGVAEGDRSMLVVGHGPRNLTALDLQGISLWTQEIQREPSPWPWWELVTPAPVQVAGGRDDKGPFFAVGCGDIQARCFGGDGKERWRRRYNEGVPGRIRVAAIDATGKPRIVVGGDILTDQSTCRIMDPDNHLLAELSVEGWSSRMTSLAFGKTDDRHLMTCGANFGNTLHLFECKNADSSKNNWTRLWCKRLGGEVTGIVVLGSQDRLVAGTSQGFLICYDLRGDVVWRKLFAQGIRHLALRGAEVLVSDNSVQLSLVTLSGSTRRLSTAVGVTSAMITTETGVYLVSGHTIWRL